MLKKLFFSSMVIVGLSNTALAAARFNAGACISQGNWLQAALQQSDVVANAINTLRNDPDCKVIIDALANSPKVERQSNDDEETNSFANMYQELSAINDYLKPERLGKSIALPGASAQKFREVVFQLVFNKSYDSIRQVQGDNFGSLAPRVEEIKRVSLNLKSFLDKSKKIANMTMATSKNLLAAIPQSKMCLHNKPSEAAAIFGAIAHSAAALTTGGQVNGVGEFISALLQFNRDMSYIKVLQPLEMARFQASVSCLIESTSESYCSTVDAEETLDYYKDINLSDIQKQRLQEVVENKGKDNVANPLGGLIILMRDVPILSSWMQKVLFGINPKISAEGKMKNEQWGAYLGFLQSLNSLQANFNELESLYYRDTDTKSNAGKLGQVRSILNKMVGIMIGGSGYDPDGGGSTQINFFLRTFQSAEAVPFILLGMSQPPATFNTRTNDFDQHWTSWANTGANGFNDPDALLRKIKEQVWITMEGAQREANNYFAARMVVDPQNLLAEAMKGPGVSAYQALIDIRNYYQHLAEKLRNSAAAIANDPLMRVHFIQYRSTVALVDDSVEKANRMIKALESTGDIGENNSGVSTQIQSQKVMDVIYEAAMMMVARDSFIGNRVTTALQADVSDTLWRHDSLKDKQLSYFMSTGPEIVSRLSGYFTTNPVLQRSDVSQAKEIHIANLEATEKLFAKVLFSQILNIDCKLWGGFICSVRNIEYDPSNQNEDSIKNSFDQRLFALNDAIRQSRKSGFKGLLYSAYDWYYKSTEDSRSLSEVRSRLCMQTLAFKSRDQFAEICRGAKLISDFANKEDSFGLNMDFDKQLAKIHATEQNKSIENPKDQSRNLGVCSLRSYWRKNSIFYMYREYQEATNDAK